MSAVAECYTVKRWKWPRHSGSGRYSALCRGVAQPGRAPGSGPGGRRFKSSLPDQSFQALELHFWFSVYIDGVDFVGGGVFRDFLTDIRLGSPFWRTRFGPERE